MLISYNTCIMYNACIHIIIQIHIGSLSLYIYIYTHVYMCIYIYIYTLYSYTHHTNNSNDSKESLSAALENGVAATGYLAAPRRMELCGGKQASGGTKRATSKNVPLLRLQSSEGKFTMSREIEPIRRSFCRRRSRAFTEVASLVPSGLGKWAVYIYIYIYVYTYYIYIYTYIHICR